MHPSLGPFRSLYVHFPFCEARCHYCDFYALALKRTKKGDQEEFLQALETESRLWSHTLDNSIDSVFLGGGTPSLTSPPDLAKSLAPLELHRKIHSDTEWTMEMNPSSLSFEKLTAYRDLGVNRVSLGVQSLQNQILTQLGRVHDQSAVFEGLEAIFKSGYSNVSVDLMCGLPSQTLDDLQDSIDRLVQFPITHLSCYLLTLKPEHPMYPDLPSEDVQLEHLQHIHSRMSDHGFIHYEISNFCKPGFEAKHNLVYWKSQPYLGLGPSAHSYGLSTNPTRWKNVSSLNRYCELLREQKLPTEWTESLSEDQIELENWMLGLRLHSGVPHQWLKSSTQKNHFSHFVEKGLMETHPQIQDHIRLTPKGFALSDMIIGKMSP